MMYAVAGSDEKLDAVVTADDSSDELRIVIRSPVKDLFGTSQRKAVMQALDEMGVERGSIEVDDAQAPDAVLRARVRAAVIELRERGGRI